MLLDRTHCRWMLITALLAAAATGYYFYYALGAPGGPSGGTVPGLLFGMAAAALMAFCGLLSLRKKLPRWRLGTAQAWLRAHIWLGLLSVPLVFFHTAFRWGGAVEFCLMLVFLAVIASGVFGLIVQQYLPRAMTYSVPWESMVEQVPHICSQLRATTDAEAEKVCGSLVYSPAAPATNHEANLLRQFYLAVVRPYLAVNTPPHSPLASGTRAGAMFAQMRAQLSPDLQTMLAGWAARCEERRQLAALEKLHGWLHGWLVVHLALSISLLVLGLAHAATAVWY